MRREGGSLLVELLIAIAILSLVTVAGGMSIANAVAVSARSADVLDHVEALRAERARDLEAARACAADPEHPCRFGRLWAGGNGGAAAPCLTDRDCRFDHVMRGCRIE